MFTWKRNKVFQRVADLYYYLSHVDFENTKIKQSEEEKQYYITDVKVVYFDSELGSVKVTIVQYGNREYRFEYCTYAGSHVFQIYVTPHQLFVQPMLIESLTAHDIDMALYELEGYLQEKFGSIEDLKEQEKQKKIAAKIKQKQDEKLHREQLKLLNE